MVKAELPINVGPDRELQALYPNLQVFVMNVC